MDNGNLWLLELGYLTADVVDLSHHEIDMMQRVPLTLKNGQAMVEWAWEWSMNIAYHQPRQRF